MASPYYPLNYYVTRPFARKMLKDFQAYKETLAPRVSEKIVMDHLLPWLQAQGLDVRDHTKTHVVSQELQGALAWGQWSMVGRKIINVGHELSQAFEQSDCGEMRIADVLPEGSFCWYLHFGDALQESLLLAEGCLFEGAYLIGHPTESLRVVLCARAPARAGTTVRWQERYDLRIDSKYFGTSADEALDFALADDLADLRNAKQALESRGAGATLASVDTLTQRMIDGNPVYKKALRLVLNTLAYLKTYSEDSRHAWPPIAPGNLVALANGGSPNERRRSTSKLWELGFVPVTYIGDAFEQTLLRNTPAGTVRAHWRRGHWRNQPHGPQMSLRKLIWLRPTLVGAEPH